MYKYDPHVHTSETSGCGKLTAVEMLNLYNEAGYNGIVITDHYHERFFSNFSHLPWSEQIDTYLQGYYSALEHSGKLGITVLLGLELRLTCSPNDFLLYGVDIDFLIKFPHLYNFTYEQLRDVTKAHGILIFQAHPFRPGMAVLEPQFIDGIEVFNGNPRHEANNDMALKYAKTHGLLEISGSDSHQITDIGLGGLALDKPISSLHELIHVISAGKARLIKNKLRGDPNVY